ncbi:MFS transporter [Fodinicola feengrottensis]|uniref:MFS transporter n=1 Tax=Fodinicola feengrottensis TaxID=435914 RepID=A0ABP4U864_9ACTN
MQWTGMLANRLGTFVQPFLALYLTVARGLTIAQAGVILVIYGVGSLIGPLLGGLLADHLNRRVALGGSMVVSAATLMALGAASTTPTIAITAFAAGMAADLYRPASGALIADIVPVSQRARAYGLLFWANNLGFAVGAMAGGWLAERGYGLLFVLDAATCLVFGALIFFATKTNTRPKPAAHEPAVGYRTALRDPLLLGMLGLTALYATIYTQADVTLPLTMHGAGLSAASYGIALAVNGVLIVVLQPFATAWLSRFNQMRVQAASGALLGVGFGLTALAHSQWAFVGSVVVWTIGELGTAGFAQSLIADLAPTTAQGRYQALFNLSRSSAYILAPAAGTTALSVFGPAGPWIGCLVSGLVLAAGYLVLARPVLHRRAAATRTTAAIA